MNKIPKVAIIGRANVGKSTLFNRLTEKRQAIVSNIPGTTRDRNYAKVFWNGLNFEIIDTGGLDIVHDKAFEEDVIKQANFALKEADLILFAVDAKTGLMPQDKVVAAMLKKSGKKIILTATKADNLKLKNSVADFYQLGLGEPIAVSGINGSGSGDLLDVIVSSLKIKGKGKQDLDEHKDSIKIAIIGKPNVGKSSIINSILEEERTIVSPQAYTTRDSQNIDFTYQDQKYILIDTAGIRKHSKIKDRLEKYSVGQSLKSINKADVVLLVTDISEPLGKQDKHLSDEIIQAKGSVIMVANKWDLIPDKDEKTYNKFTEYYQAFFPYLTYAPIIFTSAQKGQRMKNILDLAKEVYQERFREISENALDRFLNSVLKKHPPAKGKGTKKPRLHHLKQTAVDPPQFELVKDFQSDLHLSYVRFMENQLRKKFGFLGSPLIIRVRKLKN